LAHDIGNPPFGHSGEASIAEWFKTHFRVCGPDHNLGEAEENDFTYFEGNAQGFRILTQIENNKWAGGLQLTYAVLGAFSKYPNSSKGYRVHGDTYIGAKKVGFFDSERDNFTRVAEKLRLIPRQTAGYSWSRHPLAFLVEAADDICYAIIDIEDGYELGYLTFSEAEEILAAIAGQSSVTTTMPERDKIAKWRAIAIGKLVNATADAFKINYDDILCGIFRDDLISHTEYKDNFKKAKDLAQEKIYGSEKKLSLRLLQRR
jgi:dGTPase